MRGSHLPLIALVASMLVAGGVHGADAPRMPMPVDRGRTADARWLSKPVLENRLLDGMEDLARWRHNGPGQASLSAERAREGRHSLRLVCPTKGSAPSRSGRPWAEAVLVLPIDNEDWSGMNRLSFWVYPTMEKHKIGSVVIKLNREGPEKNAQPTHGWLHYALVKPGEWNHIVWEITHLSRERVTGVELIYRQQGHEPGAADTVTLDFDQLELQRVEPDHFEGWMVAPKGIAVSHTGYEANSPKTAISSEVDAEVFTVVDAVSGKTLLEKPVRRVRSELGAFPVLDFSEVKTPGEYVVRAGKLSSPPFRIGRNIWRDTVWKTINFFYCERCGQAIPGIHDVCHEDWQAEHGGKRLIINGGWHDAGDLSQGLINTGEATYAMFDLAERLAAADPAVSSRLIEEAVWGLAWLHKTRFGDGFRVTWATMDYWTDGKIGTIDDTFGDARNGATDNFVGSAASAIAARLLKNSDPALAKKSLEIAVADWQFANARLNNPNVEALGAGALASIELFKTTGEKPYIDKAVEFARAIVASQQTTFPDWQISLTGFFYTNPRRDRILNYSHRAHDQAPVVPLVELCRLLPDHPDWMQWYGAVALHSEYLHAVAAFQEPWRVLPAGIYRLGDRPEQVSRGMKLSETHYLRRFPVWDQFRGNFGILLSQTKALSSAARLRHRPELEELCQLQLQWVVGRNPFGQSTMYGEGYDYAPQYTALSGDMVGSLPVGIQTRLNDDLPYWPVTNCWNYKEVWVHPSSRWLYIMADLMPPPAPAGRDISFELAYAGAADGRITITARIQGAGRHELELRGFNLEVDQPRQFIELQPGASRTLTWSASIRSADGPWVAALIADRNLGTLRDLVSPVRR